MKAKSKSGSKGASPSFPIVGIGASAGGLSALHCFVGALPKKFGFAVVFMQHLSTKHKSLLPELLRNRRPDIGIDEIADGLELFPGKIYVCPPGADVSIRNDVFHVALFPKGHVHLPIDEFFISLAEGAGERAIGLVFSGAGTDGARGTQAIRDAGGTVFVQDPATAEFPSMPFAAINTGRADRVLPPEEIAREILKLRQAVPPAADTDITPAEFETFFRLVHEKTGYRFNHYKKSVILRRVRRRMYLRGVSTVGDYIRLVAEKDSEAASLASDLMIGVTSFFRDRLAWKALRIEVIRKLAAEDKDQPVRIWCPACATGEEAYSIAMMLRDEFDLAGLKREIQVFATDVNDAVLERAREGKYPGSIVADVSPDYMKKFFTCSEDGLSVIIGKEIRESVVFAKQDLLTDPPFSRLDLIICRNLLIYLEPEAQEKCIALFHYALRDGGYLFLGNAESAGRDNALFKSLGHKRCRVYRKIETKQPARLSLTVPFASERVPSSPVPVVTEYQQSVIEFIQHALLEESGPAAVAVNQHHDIIYNSGPTHRYLRQPRGAPTQNFLELLPEKMRNRIRGALFRAGQEARPVSLRTVIPDDDEREKQVTLIISKLRENLFLIVFRPKGYRKDTVAETRDAVPLEAVAVDEAAVHQLESELSATRAELQSHIEQLKSLNEELQSSNEELQAANEELETSREELQSLNEELTTVNSQLQSKIEEQEETNDDLNNFLASTNIPTVFLDTQFRVKRFTPAMSRLLQLIPSDVGRPIIDMSQEGLGPDLIIDAREVLDHLAPVKKEIRIDDVWYIRAALPYRTSDNRIEGVVITYNDVSDLKRAEERTQHLASFPQLNPSPVCEVDASGSVTFCNPATEKILESLGMDRRDVGVFVPHDLHSVLADWDRKNDASHYRELAIKDRVFSANIYLNSQINAARIYAFDITERKKAEDKLRESEARLRLFIEHAPAALAMFDTEMRYLNVSRRWLSDYGLGESDLISKSHYDVFPEMTAEWREAHRRGLAGEVLRAEADRFERADGSVQWVRWEIRPWHTAAGEVGGIVIFTEDITGRKNAEEALRESQRQNEFLADIVRRASQPVGVGYPDGRLGLVNEAFEELTGYTSEELHSIDWSEALTPPEWWEIERKKLEELHRTGEAVRYEKEYVRKDGTRIPIELLVHIVTDSKGDPQYYFSFITDITDRRKTESEIRKYLEELRNSNEELMRFNSVAVGRELQMVELKKEVNELCGKTGEPPRYRVDFDE